MRQLGIVLVQAGMNDALMVVDESDNPTVAAAHLSQALTQPSSIEFEVADVCRPLVSLVRVVKATNMIVFD